MVRIIDKYAYKEEGRSVKRRLRNMIWEWREFKRR